MKCGGGQVLFIEKGKFGDVPLNGLAVAAMGQSPEGKTMMESFGCWEFAYLYIDEKATPAQRKALEEITNIVLPNKASKKTEAYTILGAWDGDPDRNIISYQTAIGQALLGKKAGEVATLPNGECEIVSIEPAPVDKPVAEPVSETEPVSA